MRSTGAWRIAEKTAPVSSSDLWHRHTGCPGATACLLAQIYLWALSEGAPSQATNRTTDGRHSSYVNKKKVKL